MPSWSTDCASNSPRPPQRPPPHRPSPLPLPIHASAPFGRTRTPPPPSPVPPPFPPNPPDYDVLPDFDAGAADAAGMPTGTLVASGCTSGGALGSLCVLRCESGT